MSEIKCGRQVKSLFTYVDNIYVDNIKAMISVRNITVEHRNNNAKRDFLFVNKVQCKHIPNSPEDMIAMCGEIASVVRETLNDDGYNESDSILVIGFAETATAIGEFVAEHLDLYMTSRIYITQTTRENVIGAKEILNFEEEHSHATTHKLLKKEGNNFNLNMFNYILFVEDEITTGNTILNFVNAMREQFDGMKNTKFGVASICNWQNSKDTIKFRVNNIDIFYLIHGSIKDTNVKMLENSHLRIVGQDRVITGSKPYVKKLEYKCNQEEWPDNFLEQRTINEFNGMSTAEYGRFNECFVEKLAKYIDDELKASSYRIIGTEEFMGLPIRVGRELEKLGKLVICHATTRSNIDVLNTKHDGEGSGIKKRYKVPSAYDNNRENYIYNLSEYTEAVVVISDTPNVYMLYMLALAIGEVASTSEIAYLKM